MSALRMRSVPLRTLASFLTILGSAAGQCVELQHLRDSAGAPGDYFGHSTAARGGVAVFGAVLDSTTTALQVGSATVFREGPTEWFEQDKLEPTDGAAGDFFGWAVATDGTRVVVGAVTHDSAAGDAGAVYVYEFDGSHWVLEAKLTAGDAAAFDYFGYSVSVSGDVLVAGAPGCDLGGTDRGAVYVYRHDSSSGWTFEQKITATDVSNLDGFGQSVSVDGERILVGSPGKDRSGLPDAGQAYVFERIAGTWTEVQALIASDAQPSDLFGRAVSLRGTLAAIGAPDADPRGISSGAAYVFRHDGTSFLQDAKFSPPETQANARFGAAVATDGASVLVGAPLFHLPAIDTGAAWSFVQRALQWSQDQRLQESDGTSYANVGTSVALDGNRAFAGAIRSHDSGSGLVFRVAEFALIADPDSVFQGDPITFTAIPGTPGGIVLFCLYELNGKFSFLPLIRSSFGADCAYRLSTTTPSGLSGITAGFAALKFDGFGKVVQSNVEAVTFQ